MKNKIRNSFWVILFMGILPLLVRGQQGKIDSLQQVLKTAKHDTTKVNTLNALCIQFRNTGEYEQAKKYADEALAIANRERGKEKQSPTILKGKSNSYNNIGNIYYYQGNYPEALKNYFVSLKIRKEIEDKKGIATSYNNIGIIYRSQGNYPEALKNYFASLKMREGIGDKEGIAASYTNIGNICWYQGNYPEALKNHFASLKISEEIGDKEGMANSYNNIGNVFAEQENYPEALKNHFASLKIKEEIGDKQGIAVSYNNIGIIYTKQSNYPEALKNHFASLKIKEEFGDKQGIATSYNNIGGIYAIQGNYPEALKNDFASLKIKEEIGDKQGIATSYRNIGSVYTKQKKYSEAKRHLNSALSLSSEMGSKKGIKDSYGVLSTIDSMQGNWKAAYEHHKLFIVYRDSLINEETKEKTIQEKMNYEFEKKEAATKAEQDKKDAVTAEEKKQNVMKLQQEKKQRYYLYGGLVLVLVFAGFMFNRFKVTQKQKQIIELKEQETQQQKQLVEEKNKEITDSITYAKRLQDAILPPQEYINQYLPNNFVLYKPKDIVAGDFYWMEVVNDLVFIAAADSTGHGVPGAMVSVVCSNALNRTVKEFGLKETGKILDKTRELVLETFAKSTSDVKDGMDISLLCINQINKKVFWSGANNPLWYILNGELKEIKANKQPIGKTERPVPFTTHQIEYKKNTTFYLFTDGFADQFGGENGKKFMYKQLEKKLLTNIHLPLAEQQIVLENEFQEWKGALEQVDDVCIIGIRI